MKEKYDYSLLRHNTFGIDAVCKRFVDVATASEAQEVARSLAETDEPFLIIGGGSNLLLTGDFPGVVVHSAIRGIELQRETIAGDVFLRVGSGENWDAFVEYCVGQGWYGVENLSLIPGEVGASAVQNIGAYGVEAKDIIAGIRAWDRVERRFVDIDPAECEYGYRTSRFKTAWKGRFVITSVTYRLSRAPKPVLDYGGIRKALEIAGQAGNLTPQLIRDTIIGIRRKKLPDPQEIGSAGSFFCNPVISREHFEKIVATARQDNGDDYEVPHYVVGDMIKIPAAWMIEQCGFKGMRLGGAEVYRTQPLVIVNATGDAEPADILALERCIISTISAKYGITLHPEVEHI